MKNQISLVAMRADARMTQEEVARKLHVGKQTIVNWEKGKSVPSFASIKALVDLYGFSVEDVDIFLAEKST